MNRQAFPLPLKIQDHADGSRYEFELLEPFVYEWSGGRGQPARSIVVPAGFRTDFASIPRPVQGLLDAVNDVAPGSVVHDFLYTSLMFEDRAQADGIFYDALRANGVGWIRARALWLGVRLGGAGAWADDLGKASEWFIRGAEAADAWERAR